MMLQHRRTAGSTFLRAIMAKFNAAGAELTSLQLGAPYTGHEHRPLKQSEETLRGLVKSCSMSEARARRVFDFFDSTRPYNSRAEFIEAIASLTSLYRHEVLMSRQRVCVCTLFRFHHKSKVQRDATMLNQNSHSLSLLHVRMHQLSLSH